MKYYNKNDIIYLHKAGYTVRSIKEQLGISSTSVVQFHIDKYRKDSDNGRVRIYLGELRKLLPKERRPIAERTSYDEASNLLCAGWNACRTEFLKALEEEGYLLTKDLKEDQTKEGASSEVSE